MSTTYVCPSCEARWKIVPNEGAREARVLCPVCTPPPGQLIAQTFDVCPPDKDAA